MEGLKKIGIFFAYWITTIVGCFLTLFVVRFFTQQFDIAAAIDAPTDELTYAAFVFIVIGLVVAFKYRR